MSSILSGASYRPWTAPDVGQPQRPAEVVKRESRQSDTTTGLLTAAQLAQIQQQAYAEGFARGRAEGLANGAAEVEMRAGRLDEMLAALSRPLQALDEEVVDQLVALAVALARQLSRRELKAEPGEIVAVVREAVGALPAAAREVAVHLHPEDAALVRECLALGAGARPWIVVEDPVLLRGDCRVSSDISRVEATLEHRLNAQIAAMLGGARAGDQPR